MTELERPLWRIVRHRFLYPEDARSPADIALACDDFRALATPLEQRLKGDYMVADTFSLADLTLAYTLRWSRLERVLGVDLLAPHPRLQSYLDKHTSRPAFPRELYE